MLGPLFMEPSIYCGIYQTIKWLVYKTTRYLYPGHWHYLYTFIQIPEKVYVQPAHTLRMPSVMIYKENLTNSGLTKFKFNIQETQYVETNMVNLNNTVIIIPVNIHLCTH